MTRVRIRMPRYRSLKEKTNWQILDIMEEQSKLYREIATEGEKYEPQSFHMRDICERHQELLFEALREYDIHRQEMSHMPTIYDIADNQDGMAVLYDLTENDSITEEELVYLELLFQFLHYSIMMFSRQNWKKVSKRTKRLRHARFGKHPEWDKSKKRRKK